MNQAKVFRSGFGRLFLLFLGIPFLLLAIIGSYTMGRFEEHAERERLALLESELDLGVSESSVAFYLIKRINAFWRLLRSKGPDSVEVARFYHAFSKVWGIPCSAYIYQNRKLTRTFPDNAAFRSTFETILIDLNRLGEDFKIAQRKNNQALLTIFGPSNRLELLLNSKGKLRRFTHGTNGESNRGAYIWKELPNGLGLFIVIPQPPDFQTRFSAIRKRLPPNAGAALPPANAWFPPAGTTKTDMRIALQKTVAEGRNQTQYRGFNWIFCQGREGAVWCSAKTFPATGLTGPIESLVFSGYLISVVFFLLFILAQIELQPGLNISDRLESLSIRTRLGLLFALATVLPLGIAVILGSIGLMDRREFLLSEAGRESLSRLSQLEQGYKSGVEQFKKISISLRNSPSATLLRLPQLESRVNRLVKNRAIQRFEIRDSAGKLFFSTDDPLVHGVSHAMDLFSRVAIRRHAPSRLGTANEKISAEELMGEELLSSDDMGLAALLRQPGKVWTFKMGVNPCIWYWDIYDELATGPAFIAVTHQIEYLYEGYIRTTLVRGAPANPLRLAVEMGEESTSFRTLPGVSAPGWLPLLRACARSLETGRVLFRELELPHGRFWVTVKPEITLGMFILADLVPVASRLQTLSLIKWRLAATVLFSLIISFLGATLISSFFIVPIGDLSDGIAAIRVRDATFRIPVRRKDEFGLVAEAFNTLLGELKELQYGRVVQESLLPMNPPHPEGYSIDCMRLPATDLAGDYHDVFQIGEDKWALIMGDVTGHGISAALAMAMAKATVDYQSLTGWTVPAQVMENLNRLFYRELKPRQKFMTLCYLVLEPSTGKINAENAGHPYPLLYRRATDSLEELAMPSMPLGAKKNRRAFPLTSAMERGDALLMYSDGFVECPSPNDTLFGFPHLNNLFSGLIRSGKPLDKILEVMEKTLRDFKGPGPFPDDVTLLIVKRN